MKKTKLQTTYWTLINRKCNVKFCLWLFLVANLNVILNDFSICVWIWFWDKTRFNVFQTNFDRFSMDMAAISICFTQHHFMIGNWLNENIGYVIKQMYGNCEKKNREARTAQLFHEFQLDCDELAHRRLWYLAMFYIAHILASIWQLELIEIGRQFCGVICLFSFFRLYSVRFNQASRWFKAYKSIVVLYRLFDAMILNHTIINLWIQNDLSGIQLRGSKFKIKCKN